jgi:hypothetical protein
MFAASCKPWNGIRSVAIGDWVRTCMRWVKSPACACVCVCVCVYMYFAYFIYVSGLNLAAHRRTGCNAQSFLSTWLVSISTWVVSRTANKGIMRRLRKLFRNQTRFWCFQLVEGMTADYIWLTDGRLRQGRASSRKLSECLRRLACERINFILRICDTLSNNRCTATENMPYILRQPLSIVRSRWVVLFLLGFIHLALT